MLYTYIVWNGFSSALHYTLPFLNISAYLKTKEINKSDLMDFLKRTKQIMNHSFRSELNKLVEQVNCLKTRTRKKFQDFIFLTFLFKNKKG